MAEGKALAAAGDAPSAAKSFSEAALNYKDSVGAENVKTSLAQQMAAQP